MDRRGFFKTLLIGFSGVVAAFLREKLPNARRRSGTQSIAELGGAEDCYIWTSPSLSGTLRGDNFQVWHYKWNNETSQMECVEGDACSNEVQSF